MCMYIMRVYIKREFIALVRNFCFTKMGEKKVDLLYN